MPASGDVRLCVFCRKRPVEPAWRPFCSERCKLQDLGRWADGTYAVPGDTPAEPGDSDENDESSKESSNF